MRLKSIPALLIVGLTVLTLLFLMSSPLSAQNRKTAQSAVGNRTAGGSTQTNPTESEALKTASATRQDTNYWFDRGALCATYGNDRAAIKYFKKALDLDPKRSGAVFEQGISYGQLGQYVKALELVDKAIKMEPENGLYYYGRGRVHLLAGSEDLAHEDFRKAAELDDEDARSYMDHLAQLEAGSDPK
jgi:tetratricopeptide (TPR) repeat protein